jgi:hypothetical protein
MTMLMIDGLLAWIGSVVLIGLLLYMGYHWVMGKEESHE